MRATRRVPRRGLTIRQLMVAVFLIAIALALAVTLQWAMLAFAIILSPALVIGTVIVLNRRKAAHQDALLWVLSIVAEKRVPLAPAVRAFSEHWGGRFRARVRTLGELMEMGQSLPDALDRLPGLLAPPAALLVRVGEETGLLSEALEEAGRNRRDRPPGGSQLLGRVLYLVGMLLVLQVVTTFMMYFIAPKLQAIFLDFGVKLPPVSRYVLQASGVFTETFLPMLVLFVLVGGVGVMIDGMISRSGGRSFLFDRLTRGRHRVTMLRALAVVVEGGRPVERGLDVLARRHPVAWFRSRLEAAGRESQGGADWIEALRRYGLIGSSQAAVLASARRVGNLPWALRELALSAERRRMLRTSAILQFLFPLAILAAGLFVFAFAVGYFGPLVTLIEVLSR